MDDGLFVPDEWTSSDTDRRRLAAFVGTKADFYLTKWDSLLRGNARRAGFNWAAFFFNGFWLAYRKMYKAAFIFLGVTIAEMAVEQLVFGGIMGLAGSMGWVNNVATFVIAWICGLYANNWYFNHASAKIAEASQGATSELAVARDLEVRGGTSPASVVGFIAVAFCIGGAYALLLGAFYS